MHFTTTTTIITASLTLALGSALPTSTDTNAKRQAPVCSGLTGTPQCCATDVLGVADLDCGNPPTTPTSVADFVSICMDIGQSARCCALPILEQDVLCNEPVG